MLPFIPKVGSVSISVPDWMSKEMLETTAGGLIGSFVFGGINGFVTSLIPEEWGTNVKNIVSAIVDYFGAYASYYLTKREPRIKYFAFGSYLALFIVGTLKIINTIANLVTGKTYVLSLEESYAIGRAYGNNVTGNFRKTTATSRIIRIPAKTQSTVGMPRPRVEPIAE